MIILGYWVQQVALEHEVSAVEEKHLLLAKNVTRDLNRYVMDIESSINLIIENLNKKIRIEGIAEHLKNIDIRYIYITDHQGNIKNKIISSSAKPSHQNKIDDKTWDILQKHITKSSKNHKIIYSNLFQSKNNKKTFFIIKHINQNNIAITALSTSYIIEAQKQISFGRRGHVAIVDRTGRAIAHPIASWVDTMKDMSFLPPVKEMKLGKTGVSKFYTPAMKADVIAGYTVVKKTGWGVMVPQPFEELVERAQSTQHTALIIMIAGITAAGLISWFLSLLFVRPIHAVIAATRFSEKEKLKFILPADVSTSHYFIPKEIQILVDSFNSMGERLNSITKQLYSKIDFANNEAKQQNLKLKEQADELLATNKELERLSTTDNLTSLFNRRLFDEMLESEFSFSKRHKECLSLIIIDIDYFKKINDQYGHSQGDKALIEIATILKNNLRGTDAAFRIGGEEFAVLCRRTNYEESKTVAENIRMKIEQHEFKFNDKIFHITGSLGVVTIPSDDFSDESLKSLYRHADKAMYNSKNKGRNKVTHYNNIKSST